MTIDDAFTVYADWLIQLAAAGACDNILAEKDYFDPYSQKAHLGVLKALYDHKADSPTLYAVRLIQRSLPVVIR